MNRNIVILIFLGLMIAAAVFSMRSYSQLQNEKKAKQEALDTLKITLAKNEELKLRTDSIYRALTALIPNPDSTNHRNDSKTNTEKTTLIRELKTVNETYTKLNNLSAYQKAYELEKEGFEALTKNNFDLALQKIALAEKTSSGFHMCYEISQLLRQKQRGFKDPDIQYDIKKQIIEKYSWKAPAGPLAILKSQVKGTPDKTKPLVIQSIKWPVKKTQ